MTEVLVGPPAGTKRLLLRELNGLDPRSGVEGRIDLRIARGRIVELGEGGSLAAQEGEEVVEGGGRLWVFPAFFDPHVHLRAPGEEHKEGLETGTQAAAAGGFWAVLAMANTTPPIDSVELLAALQERARQEAAVMVGFFATLSQGLGGTRLSELAMLREGGAVGFSDDGKPVANPALLRTALRYQRLCGGVIALHEEDPALAGGGAVREGPTATRLALPGIPAASESAALARDLELIGEEGGRVHILHLSTCRSVELLGGAKERGLAVSGEVTPHHLILDEQEVATLDTAFKVNPPLGNGKDRQALLEGLRSGVIDCIATDHAPHAPEDKEVPFEQAAMGTTGLETAFAALYTHLVEPGLLPLSRLVEALSGGATLYGLEPATIAKGAAAHLAIVDLEAAWVAGEQGWRSKATNCCFAGRRLQGRVVLTLCAGQPVHTLLGEVVQL